MLLILFVKYFLSINSSFFDIRRSIPFLRRMSETEIYFCGSIRAGRDDVDLYAKIVDKLAAFGKVSFPGKTFPAKYVWFLIVLLDF